MLYYLTPFRWISMVARLLRVILHTEPKKVFLDFCEHLWSAA